MGVGSREVRVRGFGLWGVGPRVRGTGVGPSRVGPNWVGPVDWGKYQMVGPKGIGPRGIATRGWPPGGGGGGGRGEAPMGLAPREEEGVGPRGEVGGVDRRLLEDASLDGPRDGLVSLSGVGTRERVARE